MSESPSETTTEPTPSFPFDRLLPEIQLLVLEAALPPQRIFHVSGHYGYRDDADQTVSRKFTFYIRHAPPAVLAVCRAARAACLRHGLFLDGAHGAFFQPAVDMLYLDRNDRPHFRQPPGVSLSGGVVRVDEAAWRAIRHVGLEWRAFFGRTPRPTAARTDLSGAWREALAPLRRRMPQLRSVTYVLPRVRRPGGLAWGREPYGAQRFAPELVPLPDETKVPWGDALVLEEMPTAPGRGRRGGGQQQPTRVALTAELLDGRKSYLVPWAQMKAFIETSLSADVSEQEKEADAKWWREQSGIEDMPSVEPWPEMESDGWARRETPERDWPKIEIIGSWLLRKDASYDEDVTSFPN